jgi:hypothetical protein
VYDVEDTTLQKRGMLGHNGIIEIIRIEFIKNNYRNDLDIIF